MHVLHPAPLGALPLEGNYPKPPAQNPGRRQSLGGYPWSLFSFVSFHFGLLQKGFGLLGFNFLSFWPFVVLFPFMRLQVDIFYIFWALISFHFGLLWCYFLSFLAFSPVISFHFGLLRLQGGYPLHLRGSARGPPRPQVAKNGPFPRGF